MYFFTFCMKNGDFFKFMFLIKYPVGNCLIYLFALLLVAYVAANDHAKRLYDDLMANYNRMNRPVKNTNDTLTVKTKLRLAQIIDLNEREQIMLSSIWLQQEWHDYKLTWDPVTYHNTGVLYVPTDLIWVPDLLIYNSVESKVDLIQGTKATIYSNGTVRWDAPALAKTICQIKVRWYPFDIQTCEYKFGSWSFPDNLLDLQHFDKAEQVPEKVPGTQEMQMASVVKHGIDLSDYYPSVEWEILEIPATRRKVFYLNRIFNPKGIFRTGYVVMSCTVTLRRFPLFHIINLVFPCVLLLFLTVGVFYLPTESGEKIGLSINCLVCLTVFFLPLTENFSANGDAIPLIVEFLIFILIMVSSAITMTIYVLNLRFRSPNTHRMPKYMKKFFMKTLPKYLFMTAPEAGIDEDSFRKVSAKKSRVEHPPSPIKPPRLASLKGKEPLWTSQSSQDEPSRGVSATTGRNLLNLPGSGVEQQRRQKIMQILNSPQALKAFANICYIAEMLKKKDKDDKVDQDWKFISMVVDRLFLFVYIFVAFSGVTIFVLRTPLLHETSKAYDPFMDHVEN